jgi:5-methylcytosine-specific restriction endonuclease McrBC GTP-binding regulatory subunit McrB
VEVVQFHPSYSYEDFIEGIRPNKEGGFSTKPGIFKRFVEKASRNSRERFVFIINEINRGDIAKIFGELIHLLLNRDKKIRLTYSSGDEDKFAIPSNVYIIATMNSQDKSVAFLDYANRRRFSMKKFYPDMHILSKWLDKNSKFTNIQELIRNLEAVNQIISQKLDDDFQIGHSYFMEDNMDYEKIKRIIEYELRPLVEQYFFGKANVQVLTQIEIHFKNILECTKKSHSEATENVHGYTL